MKRALLLIIVRINYLEARDGNYINQDCHNVKRYFLKLFEYKSKGKITNKKKRVLQFSD